VITKASIPNAAGRLKVISGNRFARICSAFLVLAVLSNSVPHTMHLVAESFNRVPHTGQSFVFEVFVSWLIVFPD
jgi:hypothetical protein